MSFTDPTQIPGGGGPLTGLIAELRNMVRNSSQSLVLLAKLTGNLAANYSTNTWTPSLTIGGVTTGITYGTQLGTVTILGREVVCRFRIVLTSKGAQNGNLALSGLPAISNADATNNGAGGILTKYASMASLAGVPLLNVGPSSSVASLLSAGAAATAALTDANLTNTSELDGFFSFFT